MGNNSIGLMSYPALSRGLGFLGWSKSKAVVNAKLASLCYEKVYVPVSRRRLNYFIDRHSEHCGYDPNRYADVWVSLFDEIDIDWEAVYHDPREIILARMDTDYFIMAPLGAQILSSLIEAMEKHPECWYEWIVSDLDHFTLAFLTVIIFKVAADKIDGLSLIETPDIREAGWYSKPVASGEREQVSSIMEYENIISLSEEAIIPDIKSFSWKDMSVLLKTPI